jgi:nucleotide-binding universal stress UspA family protein
MFKHILLPTDGSKLSQIAVDKAISLATALNARITVVSVVDQPRLNMMDEGFAVPDVSSVEQRLEEIAQKKADGILEQTRAAARAAGIRCDVAAPCSNTPYAAIIEQAQRSGCDVIVMASHGRRGLPGLLLGSETIKVLTHSTIPVLVCR